MSRPLTVLLCALLLGLGLVACGDDDDSDGGAATATETAEPAQEPSEEGGGGGACADVEQPPAKPDGGTEKPSQALDPGATYDVVLKTSCGDITIRLDQRTSPKTAASFAGLAEAGFFDGTVFHRIVPGFVIQGGDPTASGGAGTPLQPVVIERAVVRER